MFFLLLSSISYMHAIFSPHVGRLIIKQWMTAENKAVAIKPYVRTLIALRRPGASCVLQGSKQNGFTLFAVQSVNSEMHITSYMRSRPDHEGDRVELLYNLRNLQNWSCNKFKPNGC